MINNYFKEEVLQSVEKFIEKIWNCNRYFDRACSVLKVKFQMDNLEEVLHQEYAHYFPKFSDYVVDYLEGFNQAVVYPQTMRGDENYENPIELISDIRRMFEEFFNDFYVLAEKVRKDYPDFYHFLTNYSQEISKKMQKIIKIETLIGYSLRPESEAFDIIDLDNYVKWQTL